MSEPQQQGWFHHCCHHDQDPLACIGGQLAELRAQIGRMDEKLETIMSEDAAVQAVVADENTQIANLTTAVTALQGLVAALQAEPPTALQPGTLAALQSADAALDSLSTTASADVTADTPATPPAS